MLVNYAKSSICVAPNILRAQQWPIRVGAPTHMLNISFALQVQALAG